MLCQEHLSHLNYTSSAQGHPIYSLAVQLEQLKTTDRGCGAAGTNADTHGVSRAADVAYQRQ